MIVWIVENLMMFITWFHFISCIEIYGMLLRGEGCVRTIGPYPQGVKKGTEYIWMIGPGRDQGGFWKFIVCETYRYVGRRPWWIMIDYEMMHFIASCCIGISYMNLNYLARKGAYDMFGCLNKLWYFDWLWNDDCEVIMGFIGPYYDY